MDLRYNEETGVWEAAKEPYAVMEFPTEEDYNHFCEMVKFWAEHHKESEDE